VNQRARFLESQADTHLLEFLWVLVGEDSGLGGEAVAESVEVNGGASFGSSRAGAELGVATIGVDLALGKHNVSTFAAEADLG
jgi:hypothetical protein